MYVHLKHKLLLLVWRFDNLNQNQIIKLNIARGTTDPGYWVHNSNHPPWQIKFKLREIRGYKNKKYYFLSFVKILKSKKEVKESRPCQQCRLNNQHASAVWMIWVMDSIPWVRCASGNVYKTQEVVFLVFVSPYFL